MKTRVMIVRVEVTWFVRNAKRITLRKGGGKPKGGGYERDIGYKLSLWLSGGTRRDLICRTVGSGAQFTSANLRNTTAGHPGDLRSQDPLADKFCSSYVIECKFWKNLELIRFLECKGELYDALIKVKKEAEQTGKCWLLCCRQNHRYDILLMPIEAMSKCYILNSVKLDFHAIFNGTVYMYKLDEFLAAIPPDKLLSEIEAR